MWIGLEEWEEGVMEWFLFGGVGAVVVMLKLSHKEEL